MSIQRPYNLSLRNQVIDANEDQILSWQTSGDTSASYSINIYNNADDTLAWSLARTYSFATSQTIPAGSIPNGGEYKVSVTVWNSNDQSATSGLVIFTTSSKPAVTVDAIGTVSHHSNMFTATYTQAENVELESYTVNLYNSDQVLINTSGLKTDGLLEHRFSLLKNDTSYFVEFTVRSKKGMTSSSGLIPFNVAYEAPAMYLTLGTENITEKAGIKLHWTVVQVIGKATVEPVYLDNGTTLDVRNGAVYFDEGFSVDKDFTLKIWFKSLVKNVDLIHLKGSNGKITVQYDDDNKFHMYREVSGFRSHYATGEVVGSEFFLCVQQINNGMNLISEVVA